MIPKMILLSMILPTLILHFSIFQFPNFFISLPVIIFTLPRHSLVTPSSLPRHSLVTPLSLLSLVARRRTTRYFFPLLPIILLSMILPERKVERPSYQPNPDARTIFFSSAANFSRSDVNPDLLKRTTQQSSAI